MSSIYNGQFSGNVLVVGKIGCGKTYFLQKLGLNKFFGNLVKTEQVSHIDIDEERQAEIQSCFTNKVEFHLAKEFDEFIDLIENFKLRIRDIINDEKRIVLLFWTTSPVQLTTVKNLQNS